MSTAAEPRVRAEARIAFIGGGNMARSLVSAQLAHGVPARSIRVAEPREAARTALAREFGVATFADNVAAIDGADCIVLAVKPQIMRTVCAGLAQPLAGANPLVLSIAAGVRLAQLERLLGAGHAIVRCMPNTPALIGAGAAGLYANANATPAQRKLAEGILAAAGQVRWIDHEAQMDALTALSGSGPAYFFLLVEAMEDAGVTLGLSRETARALAAQTCFGAGRMLTQTDETPATLRQRVTSPHGTTAAALDVFEQGGFRQLVARALDAACRRGAAMSSELDAEP